MPDRPSQPPRFEIEALFEHLDWVRDLAHRLVRDENQADDAVQETWTAVLTAPPSEVVRAPRAWLRAVLENVIRSQRRSDSRRALREERVARPEAESRTDPRATEERFEFQRSLVGEVDRLAEPYRTAILLRYFEGLPPRAIAAQTGRPIATVETQLARARAQLRARLDSEQGGRARWQAIVLAIPHTLDHRAAAGAVVSGTAIPVFLVTMKLTLFIAASALAVFAALRVLSPTAPDLAGAEGLVRQANATAEAEPPFERAGRDVRAPRGPAQSDADALALAPPAVVAAAPAVRDVIVVGTDGAPVVDVPLVVVPGNERVRSDAEGRVRVTLADADGVLLWAEGPKWTTVLSPRIGAMTTLGEAAVVVAPVRRLAGRVTNREDAPVPGARVVLRTPEGFLTGVGRLIIGEAATWSVQADEEGRFLFEDAPAVAGITLEASAPDHHRAAPREVELGAESVTVVLAPWQADEILEGVVLGQDGLPLDGASVTLGVDHVETSEGGRFRFQVDRERKRSSAARTLIGAKSGYGAAVFEADVDADGVILWPAFVELRLPSAPGTVRGRVVDAEGVPVAGVEVWAGPMTVREAERHGMPSTYEELLGANFTAGDGALTDASGEFTLVGLVERPYTLVAFDPVTLVKTNEVEARAGQDEVTLAFPAGLATEEYVFEVVSARGEPIQGAEVSLYRSHSRSSLVSGLNQFFAARSEPRVTDARGRVGFERVVVDEDVRISVRNDDLIVVGARTGQLRWSPGPDGVQRIVLAGERMARVELDDPPGGHGAVRVVDAEGRSLACTILWEGIPAELTYIHLDDEGRTEPFAVLETARRIEVVESGKVLYAAGIEFAESGVSVWR